MTPTDRQIQDARRIVNAMEASVGFPANTMGMSTIIAVALADEHALALAWQPADQPLPEDNDIREAHWASSADPTIYAAAIRIVNATRSKGKLVDIIHWLLQTRAAAEAKRVVECKRRAMAELLPILKSGKLYIVFGRDSGGAFKPYARTAYWQTDHWCVETGNRLSDYHSPPTHWMEMPK